jgi:hypothetical protein
MVKEMDYQKQDWKWVFVFVYTFFSSFLVFVRHIFSYGGVTGAFKSL